MTDCAMCGDCCEDFPLNTTERADIYGRKMLANVGGKVPRDHSTGEMRKQWAWFAQLEVVSGPHAHKDKDGKVEYRWRYRCPIFDSVTRTCSDHANRPPVCRRYPWYGREATKGDYRSLSPRCSFVADDPSVTLLPIVEVRNGRPNTEGQDERHRAA